MKATLVLNWKMNPASWREAKKLFDATRKAAEKAKGVSVIVAPPALYLRELAAGYKGKRIAFAAQNAHSESGGSHTGELSLLQVRDAKASYVIVGHAERRAMGETDQDVAAKVRAALVEKLTPIICVGEQARSGNGEYFTVVREQVRAALSGVQSARIDKVIIAYEPVWAIGAKKPMNAREMHEMAIYIRKTVVEMHGQGGMQVKILYGGAIDDTNAREMLQDGDVAGFILGRVSVDALKLNALIESIGA